MSIVLRFLLNLYEKDPLPGKQTIEANRIKLSADDKFKLDHFRNLNYVPGNSGPKDLILAEIPVADLLKSSSIVKF